MSGAVTSAGTTGSRTGTGPGGIRLGGSEGGFDSAFSDRVRLYLRSTFFINLLFVGLSGGVQLTGGDGRVDVDWGPFISMSCVTAFNGMAWFLSMARRQTFWSAMLTAGLTTLVLTGAYAHVAMTLPNDPMPSRSALYAVSLVGAILVLRASIVPSPTLATLVVGALCMAFPLYLSRPGVIDDGWVSYLWRLSLAIVFVAVSAVASRTIYGLERRMFSATQLGQYRIERMLGRGGMGEVYLAQHALLARPTAVKVLRDASTGSSRSRFRREVQTASGLSHPNTVEIYDYGRTSEGLFYFAMEFVEGATLEEIVRSTGPMPAERVVFLLRQAAEALGEAHERGLVHRDVKPSNLMVCERGGAFDTLKVLDFGLVRDLGDRDDRGRGLAGTPLFLAPESIVEENGFLPQSDVYALGATAFFLLTGQAPFEGGSLVEILSDHLATPAPRPDIADEALAELVGRCLAKDPAERPADARELADSLDACPSAADWSRRDAQVWWSEHAEVVAATREQNSASEVLGLSRRTRRTTSGG